MHNSGHLTLRGTWYARYIAPDGSVIDYGVVSRQKVTTAFVNYLVDSLQTATAGWATFKYMAIGTGTNAEDAGDTALQTPEGARVTATQGEGSSANIYKTVGTFTMSGTGTATEAGLFNASSGGTLMDRGLLNPTIPWTDGGQIEITFELTATAGG